MNDDTTQRGGAAACSVLAIAIFICFAGGIVLGLLAR